MFLVGCIAANGVDCIARAHLHEVHKFSEYCDDSLTKVGYFGWTAWRKEVTLAYSHLNLALESSCLTGVSFVLRV